MMSGISRRRLALTAAAAPLLLLATREPGRAEAQGTGLYEKLRKAGSIRIGITETSPPWTLLGEDNKPAGYDVAVAREMAKRIGISHVVFVADSFKNFIEGLKTGKYDLVLNDLTPTRPREEQVDFATPYGVEDFRVFVRADNKTIKSAADLVGKKVGVTIGTTNESWARAHLKGAVIEGYENGSFIFQDIALGRIDATIISHFGGLKYARADHLPVKEVGPPLSYQLSAPALAKGHPALKAAVDKAISSMRADGTIDRIAAKWVGTSYVMSKAITEAEHEAARAGQ